MEASWNSLVEDLRAFPGNALQLEAASSWDGGDSAAFVEVSLALGEVFDSKRLRVTVSTDRSGTHIGLLEVQATGEPQRLKHRRRGLQSRVNLRAKASKQPEETEAVPEGVADALAEASAAVADGSGPLYVRSALLRLCHELYVELSTEQSAALSALGRGASLQPQRPEGDREPPAGPPPLLRDASRATSGGVSALSFEDQEDGLMPTDSDDDESQDERPSPQPASSRTGSWRCSGDLGSEGPPVEEVLTWTAATDGLKRFPGNELELKSCGCWDGREGLIELVLNAPEGPEAEFEWDRLQVMLVVSARRSTSAQLKGAQVIPTAIAHAIEEVNSFAEIGSGPQSIRTAVGALFRALGLELDEKQNKFLEALGSREKSAGIRMREDLASGSSESELDRELLAVEALKVQSGLIEQQILHLEHRRASAVCLAEELEREVERLRRSSAEVSAERAAASAAVQAAMLELTDTTGKGPRVPIRVRIRDAPSQSLRGHGVEKAEELIRKGLQSSGAWGHYAAHQFATMLSREQELHGEFVCFYHSYSFAALLYEVQAEVARQILGLPADSAPVPRLAAVADGAITDLKALKKQGGRDHDPSFRALGLSCSCSVFAYGSEAPPLNCFLAGYSCTDVSFRKLLVDFLAKCCGDNKEAETLASAVVEAGRKHNLSVGHYGTSSGSVSNAPLSGYMLQVFVHRSIVEDFVYPSEAMGKPIDKKVISHLEDREKADGQARILFAPKVFLDPSRVKLYHYCARPLQSCMDADVAGSRGCLIRDLKEALSPLLNRKRLDSIRQRLKLS